MYNVGMKFSAQDVLTLINTVLVVVLFYLNKRNSRVSVVPYISVSIIHKNHEPVIQLANQGEVFALDVDVNVYGYVMDPDDEAALKDLKKRLPKGHRLPEPDREGWIGIYDRLNYYVFPKKKVTAPLALPTYIDQITIIVQFRDPSGVNYAQAYWFVKDHDIFRLNSLDPHRLRPSFRREFVGYNFWLPIWKHQKTLKSLLRLYTLKSIVRYILVLCRPRYMDRYTHQMIRKHSISSGFLKGYSKLGKYMTEDRGKWEDS